jgi:hypothetical protein
MLSYDAGGSIVYLFRQGNACFTVEKVGSPAHPRIRPEPYPKLVQYRDPFVAYLDQFLDEAENSIGLIPRPVPSIVGRLWVISRAQRQ